MGALAGSKVVAEPSILSELPEVDLQFLVFLLRMNFDTMAHFCKYR